MTCEKGGTGVWDCQSQTPDPLPSHCTLPATDMGNPREAPQGPTHSNIVHIVPALVLVFADAVAAGEVIRPIVAKDAVVAEVAGDRVIPPAAVDQVIAGGA